MAMMTLEGIDGLGAPLTSFYDTIPPNTKVQNVGLPQVVSGQQEEDFYRRRRTDYDSAKLWMSQCLDANAPAFSSSHPDADIKAIENKIAELQCQTGVYDNFPAVGYTPPKLAVEITRLTKERADLIAKKAAVVAAAKIAADEAKDKSAKDKLEVITTGIDTGKILGMDSKTFMLVAAAGLVLMMMEQK